jgi:hypothetical protein
MKYTISHLDRRHEIIDDLWSRTQNILDNENNIEDLITKLEVVIEEFNDIEAGSFMNNPIYFDFTLSYSDDEIRIAEERTSPDLIVVTFN